DFFLFSGVGLDCDATGKPLRHYLKDAFRFIPGKGWRQIADLPRAAAAAPSPAIVIGDELLIVSGYDGEQVNFELKSQHSGFPRDVPAYDLHVDKWSSRGESLVSWATVPVVEWQGAAVIAGGEEKPGRRTTEVWAIELR